MTAMSSRFFLRPPFTRRLAAFALAAGLAAATAVVALAPAASAPTAGAVRDGAPLAVVTVQPAAAGERSAYDGVVEAVRQTTLAAQVSGAVTEVAVKVGDRVRAGQVLVRLDARAAQQTAAAGDAQVRAAQASLELATRDFERQQQLARDNFISAAALERAQAQFRATQAELAAQVAGAGATRTQSEFFVLRAPYAGIVSEVPAVLGDMAMPGRALVTLYDPAALRVTAAVPQSAAVPAANGAVPVQVELPGLPRERAWIAPRSVQRLPAIDPSTHTQTLRLELPAAIEGVSPGQFARVWLPGAADAASQRVWLPASAVVRRAELTAVYVLRDDGALALRQVRLGRSANEQIEVLTGLLPGERVAVDALVATARR